jgi:hypothetical protein
MINIDLSAGVAPERMPKADATGLAPKKSAAETLPHTTCAGGFLFYSQLQSVFCIFFGEVSERRPWA